jgi:Tol biopolymer transport system component
VGVAVGAAAAGVAAFVAAPMGMAAVYVLVGLIAVGVLAYSIWDLIGPPLHDAVARVAPRPARAGLAPRRRWLSPFRGMVVVGVAGIGGWAIAQLGTKAIVAVVALVLGTVGVWLLYPLIDDLLRTPPSDVPVRAARRTDAPTEPRRPISTPVRVLTTTATVVLAGVFAWGAAQLGMKGLLAVAGAVGAAALLIYVRDRTVFFTFAAVCSLTFVLHKSFTTQDLTISGGAPSVYISTFDALVVLLYILWIAEGTFRGDVRAAMSRRILFVPLIGACFLLPSVLVGPSAMHGVHELVRMAWMYLLFFYVSVRVRTRRHVWAILGGLAVFATLEMIIVVLQAKTGGVLGLSFLGVPTELGERVTDTESLGRPFGTIIHPVFMGAVMGSLALVALGLGLTLRRSLTKVAALGLVGVSLLPLYLAHTRASLVAFALVALVMVGVALARQQLQWSTIGRLVVVGLIATVVFFPQLAGQFSDNFSTAHFSEEVESRHELNDIAGEMIDDAPVLGVGLNNFELVMAPYEKYGIIFFNHPVHNLYLLYLSETGIVGFTGVVIVGVALYNVAIRLARSRDRLLGGVGLGISGVMAFLMIEELLGFSLRQDTPLALFWLLAGLAVACSRLAGFDGNRQASSRSRLRGDGRRSVPRPVEPRVSSTPTDRPWVGDRGPMTTVPVSTPGVLPDPARNSVAEIEVGAGAPGPATDDPGPSWLDELVDDEIDLREPEWLDELVDMAGSGSSLPPTFAMQTGHRDAPRRRRFGVLGALLLVATFAIPLTQSEPASGVAGLRITFTATDRATGIQGIYTANGDGSGIVRITPGDGRQYNWAHWAYGGTKIVYTVRTGPDGGPETIELMNPDGSGVQTIRSFQFRVGQPKVSPDGRSIIFTGSPPSFREVALYELDLETLEATNLSAVTSPVGALDADPKYSPTGDRLIFANSDLVNTEINTMRLDGTDRVALTADGWYNTDPELSPDEGSFATASYRGDGAPGEPGRVSLIGVKPDNWFLVVHDTTGGAERVLTQGKSCVERSPEDACRPEETSAFKPVWTPDGTAIGYNGTLDRTRNCICVIDADGSNPRVLLAPSGLALDWFDWTRPDPQSAPPIPAVGSKARSSRLLVTAVGAEGVPFLYAASTDQLDRVPIGLPAGINPEAARWTADHRTIVFTAKVPIDTSRARPNPAPPAGAVRREHITLDELSLDSVEGAAHADAAERQVFAFDVDTGLVQLTDPWIEDWQDGLIPGDARSNTDPVISPDGRYVVFTNTSTITNESFLLRLDRQTGSVLNLTNGSAGALRVDDAHPAFSPDGSQVAFTWTNGGVTDVYVMDTATGAQIEAITQDDWLDRAPQYDGADAIVMASWRGSDQGPSGVTGSGWVVVRVDHAAGTEQVLAGSLTLPTLSLAVAPEGDRSLAVATGPNDSDLYILDGSGSSRPLQPTPYENELFVDWR